MNGGYQYLAMTDYPAPADFLEPMPAWPVNLAVLPFTDIPTQAELRAQQEIKDVGEIVVLDLIMDMTSDALSYVYDFTMDLFSSTDSDETEDTPLNERELTLLQAVQDSTTVYFNYTGQYPCTDLGDTAGTGDLDDAGWYILACNQLAMPIGDGPESMFVENPFDYDGYTAFC